MWWTVSVIYDTSRLFQFDSNACIYIYHQIIHFQGYFIMVFFPDGNVEIFMII